MLKTRIKVVPHKYNTEYYAQYKWMGIWWNIITREHNHSYVDMFGNRIMCKYPNYIGHCKSNIDEYIRLKNEPSWLRKLWDKRACPTVEYRKYP